MKKQARGREPVFCCIGSVLCSFKCLLQVGDDITGAFQTDRQTDQAIREAGGLDLFFRAHGVRHGSRMLDERLAVAEADGQRAQMHVIEHLLGFREAAHLERDNAAEPHHFTDGHGVIGMVLQTGIEHFLHILGAGKEVHHFLRVRADGVVLDSFQAGQSETGPVYDFATSTPLATREETRQFVALADELAQ